MERLLKIALEAATAAYKHIDQSGYAKLETKSHLTDYVTNLDKESEAVIREHLDKTGIPVLGEEMGGEMDLEYTWVVDPIDGTHNFITNTPLFGINIALFKEGQVVLGHTLLPKLLESYTCIKGQGVYLNNKALDPLVSSEITKPFIATPKDSMSSRARAVRSIGAASVEMAWVAKGSFSGVSYLSVTPWDVAPGVLFITELGGVATSHNPGGSIYIDSLITGERATLSELGYSI